MQGEQVVRKWDRFGVGEVRGGGGGGSRVRGSGWKFEWEDVKEGRQLAQFQKYLPYFLIFRLKC